MAKKVKAPPGLDYDPVTGNNPNLSYGTVLADQGEGLPKRRLEEVLFRRFFPTERPDISGSWENKSCEKWEVLLPRGAPDDLADPQRLCLAYHHMAGEKIHHLATIITLRFPEADEVPARMQLHEAYELGRGFGVHLSRLPELGGVSVVPVMHVPGRSWGLNPPHAHLLIPPRVLRPTGFTTFVTTLIDPKVGRRLIDAEWRSYRKAAGYGE